jgi:NitT/TauT family transport system substrate-binding protein
MVFCLLQSGCEAKKPAGQPEKITIAILTTIHPTLVKIADAKGFFREEGLDVTLQPHSSGKSALQSLLDNKADFATAADTPIMFAMMNGLTDRRYLPNFFEALYLDGLNSVKPDAIRIIR